MENLPAAGSSLLDLLPDEMTFDGQLLRLGVGEFNDRYNYAALVVARRAFLQVVSEVAPEVVGDLGRTVYPRYLDDVRTRDERRGGGADDLHHGEQDPWFPEAVRWVGRWFRADPFREEDHPREYRRGWPWLLMAAAETCRQWAAWGVDPEEDELGDLSLYDDRWFDLMLVSDRAKREMRAARKPASIRVAAQAWNPWAETRAAAEERIVREITVTVRARMDEIESGLDRKGFNRAPVKPAARDHLEWAVRYQIRGESFPCIARSVYRSRQTVAGAVHDVLETLGIPPRPASPRGRPRAARRQDMASE